MKLNPQNIIARAEEIVNADSDIRLELDLRNQAVIHALCESLGNTVVQKEIEDAEQILENIAHAISLFHSKRFSWKETIEAVEGYLHQYYGDDND